MEINTAEASNQDNDFGDIGSLARYEIIKKKRRSLFRRITATKSIPESIEESPMATSPKANAEFSNRRKHFVLFKKKKYSMASDTIDSVFESSLNSPIIKSTRSASVAVMTHFALYHISP
ncbi:hypothetical protein Ciccas_013250 [Cichlidogyrus casuarinus]|uniref:Uncharacterized protein n=1 Tax=Cichlidogyrus casuarinus TaxID=1844966 RepID=A0ABD2PL28_9PLAT